MFDLDAHQIPTPMRRIVSRLSVLLIGFSTLLFLAGCGGSDDATPDDQEDDTTSEVSTIDHSTTTEATDELPEEIERTDLLTFAEGTVFVSQTGLHTGSAGTFLRAIDGDPYRIGLSSDANMPVEFVYKLPANTTFDRFAVPQVIEQPGNVTFVKHVTVSGSIEGPDSGFQELAAFELHTHEPGEAPTEIIPEIQTPVRWVKVHFDGGILIEEGHEGRTNIWFSELIGNGTQDEQPSSDAFDGIWSYRSTERPDYAGGGIPLELHQNGSTITGCLDTIEITGTVNGSIARATGIDTLNDQPSAFIFVADEDGSIESVWSRNGSLFNARTPIVDPETTSTPCSEAPPEPVACGASVYVNFAVNSADILPESAQVLADLYDRLVAENANGVSIIGHTSTEGSDSYNQDLSERRAQSVMDDLVQRGFDASNISSEGRGETEPLISPDASETARSLNRRVEIGCASVEA